MADFFEALQQQGSGGLVEDARSEFGNIGGMPDEPIDFFSVLQGEQFEPSVSELGPPGLPGFQARFSIGRGGNFQEKMERFKSLFPQGDLSVREVEGEPTLLFRINENEPFKKVDAGLREKFEPIEDVADFLGDDLEAIIGETVATIGTRGGSLLGLAARLFGGAAGGEAVKEFEQVVEGTQRETASDIAGRAVTKGVISGVAGAGGEKVFRGAANWLTGRRLIGLKKGAKVGMKRTESIGVQPLPLNVISDAPLIQRAGILSQAIVPTLGRYVQDSRAATLQVVNKLRNIPAKTNLREGLDKIEQVAREKMLRSAQAIPSGKEINLAKAIQTWDDVAQAGVRTKYAHARGFQEPEFALDALRLSAERFKATAELQGVPIDDALVKVLSDIQSFDGLAKAVTMSDGSVITATPTEQLNAFAEQLFAISQPPLGQVRRRTEKVAGAVLRDLKNMMDDAGKTGSAEFRAAWKDAQRTAAQRFETLEKATVVAARKTENPEIFIDNLISQRKRLSVQFLKNAGINDEAFKDAFVNRMLLKPRNMTNDLQTMTPEFRRMFVTDGEEKVLRKLGKEVGKLDRLGIKEILEKQSTAGGVVNDLMSRGSGSLRVLRDQVDAHGGRNGPVGRAIRAGIIDRLYKNSIVEIEGIRRLNPSLFKQGIKELSDTGATQLMLLSDIKTLMQASTTEGFLKSLPDFGASLAGQETVSGIRGIATGDGKNFSIAMLHVMENIGVGRFLTNPDAIKFLAGGGKEPFKRSGALGAALGVMATALTDADKSLIPNLEDFDRIMETAKDVIK